jgi:hypothetical protein
MQQLQEVGRKQFRMILRMPHSATKATTRDAVTGGSDATIAHASVPAVDSANAPASVNSSSDSKASDAAKLDTPTSEKRA